MKKVSIVFIIITSAVHYAQSNFITTSAEKLKNYCEEHGKGKQAIEQTKQQAEIIHNEQSVIKTQADALNRSQETIALLSEQKSLKEAGINAFDTAAKTLSVVGNALYISASIVAFYHWMWPTEEAIIKQEEERERIKYNLELLKAQQALNHCLAKNRDGAKEANGMPCCCKEACRNYAAVAGEKAFSEVKDFFNRNV